MRLQKHCKLANCSLAKVNKRFCALHQEQQATQLDLSHKLLSCDITVVNQTGVFDMEVLYCIYPNAGTRDEKLLQAGLFSSSFKKIETVFTFSLLDDFLADNLGCKTTVQQYFSKLQSITNQMFPENVPVCYDYFYNMAHS